MYYENYLKLRVKSNVTDAAVAKATGIDPATFVHWRKGLYTPKKNKLIKIADYFRVPFEQLTYEKKNIFYDLVNTTIRRICNK